MSRAVLGVAAIALVIEGGCAKSSGDVGPDVGAAAPASSVSGHDSDSASPGPAARAESVLRRDWRGSYVSAASTVYVPADWKTVHWRGTDTAAGLGEGALAIGIDPASGRVTGTLDGPLGPATIGGLAHGDQFAAAVARKDPADRGFVGTLVGSVGSGRAEGTMNLALWDASALRSATFTLTPEVPRQPSTKSE